MALLTNLATRTLISDYAAARDGRSPRPRHRMLAAGCLALIGALLVTAFVQVRDRAPAIARERNQLIERIRKGTDAADQQQQRLEELRRAVSVARQEALATTSAGSGISSRLASSELAAGVVAVSGPGIRIVVDDAPSARDPVSGEDAEDGQPELSRVLDSDLQWLVNGLWTAEAEAISINDQRLTSLSAIRSAGRAILVDYRPLARPYIIEAIGDPASLDVRFTDGPGGRHFRTLQVNYGIRFDVSSHRRLRLPSASGVQLRLSSAAGEDAAGASKAKPAKGAS